MNTVPVIGLLTDFGFDFAVASIKGVILRSFRNAQVIDIDHTIEKFSIRSAAFVIEKVYNFFPTGTFFICVVDPGVGSKRAVLCVEYQGYTFIGPDNGIFAPLLRLPDSIAYTIDSTYFTNASNTFHGRDIFAPATVELLKENRSFLTNVFKNEVIIPAYTSDIAAYIDSFGNIKTTIPVNSTWQLGSKKTLMINDNKWNIPFVNTFSDIVKPHSLLCYTGSNNTLEIAVNGGSAQKTLNINVGTPLSIVEDSHA